MKYSTRQLEARAQGLVREALGKLPRIPDELWKKIYLETLFDDRETIFELCFHLEGIEPEAEPRCWSTPEEVRVIARAKMDKQTGEGTVEVFPELWCPETR